jgi:hypothetical protein
MTIIHWLDSTGEQEMCSPLKVGVLPVRLMCGLSCINKIEEIYNNYY